VGADAVHALILRPACREALTSDRGPGLLDAFLSSGIGVGTDQRQAALTATQKPAADTQMLTGSIDQSYSPHG
jgi:hypothetical protein